MLFWVVCCKEHKYKALNIPHESIHIYHNDLFKTNLFLDCDILGLVLYCWRVSYLRSKMHALSDCIQFQFTWSTVWSKYPSFQPSSRVHMLYPFGVNLFICITMKNIHTLVLLCDWPSQLWSELYTI